MAESLDHLGLVQLLLGYVERVYRPSYPVIVLHDMPGAIGGEKPPRINGFLPDIYAVDAPSSIVILGEAKTVSDLETDHSKRQISAFLTYVSQQHRGVLLLAVPWQASATARNLLRILQRRLGLTPV